MRKNYKKMYEDLLAEFEQYKKESIKWSVEDFTEYEHPTHQVNEEQARECLRDMIRHHDASYGVCWSDVEYFIEQYGTEK